jgi:hypothetical protein
MAKVKLTNDEMLNFRHAAQGYINRHPDRTKLHYALEKSIKGSQSAFEDYADAESDIRIETAMIDEKTKTFVMSDNKMNYVVDPSKAKELQRRMRELGRKEVEIEVRSVDAPKDFEAAWYQAFAGIVFPDVEIEDSKKELAEQTV